MSTLGDDIRRILEFGEKAKFLRSRADFYASTGFNFDQHDATPDPPFHIMTKTHLQHKSIPQGGVKFQGGVFYPSPVSEYKGGGMGGGGDNCGNMLAKLEAQEYFGDASNANEANPFQPSLVIRDDFYKGYNDVQRGFNGIFSGSSRRRSRRRRPYLLDISRASAMAGAKGGFADQTKNVTRIRKLKALQQAIATGKITIPGLKSPEIKKAEATLPSKPTAPAVKNVQLKAPGKAPPKPPAGKLLLKAPPKKKPSPKEVLDPNRKRLRKLPWTPFFQNKDTEFEGAELTVPIDVERIEADFSAEVKAVAPTDTLAKAKPKIQVVKLLPDAKRSYNMSLATAKIVKIGFDALKAAVKNLDQSVLTNDTCRTLIEFAPTPQEVKSVKDYLDGGGDITKADNAEQFVYAVMDIENLSIRLKAHSFAMSFATEIESLSKPLKLLIAASNALRNSKKFPSLLFFITRIGNILNQSAVKGIRITSYSKISELKTATKPPRSFLQYVADIIYDSPEQAILNLSDELSPVLEASKIDLLAIQQRITAFVGQFKKIEQDVELLISQGDFIVDTALGPFVQIAKDQVEKIQTLVNQAHEKFEGAAKYYGENATTLAKLTSQAYFSYAAKFVRDFSAILKEKNDKKNRDKQMAKRGVSDKATAATKMSATHKVEGADTSSTPEVVHIRGGLDEMDASTGSLQDRHALGAEVTRMQTRMTKGKATSQKVIAKIAMVLD